MSQTGRVGSSLTVKRAAVLVLGILAAGAEPASAQYFGRNKVRYENFEFRVLQTPHFDIYHYEAEEGAVAHAARLAERWYARLSQTLGHELRERQPIVFYASHAHFAQTTVLRGFLGEGVGGVTEHLRGRVVLPFAAGLGETDHVLGHELAHAFQRDILRERGGVMAALPLWFLEGMAEHLSVGALDTHTTMWLRDSVLDRRLPSIEDLDDPRWFPYRYGHALWSYLAERFGDEFVARTLKVRSGSAIARIVKSAGVDRGTLTAGWHAWIEHAVAAAMSGAKDASTGRPLVSRARGGGRLNLGPALSPDGKQIVFLSERGEYSIDVYLADAESGAIARRLVRTAADPHFDSLQFIGSAGAWDPAGRRIALAAVRQGEPVLALIDAGTGRTEREIVLAGVDEAHSPSWSPDGERLVFSALRGGLSDLYVVDLATGRLQALTADPYADMQPVWSPDARTIAFATDRFSSSVETLSFGNFRLGAIDLESGRVRELPGIPAARHINPQWSADGSSLYFVADASGRSNVHRLAVDTGEVFRVTDVPSGVSGVTALSPALSVARRAGALAYSLYRHGAYELHVTGPEDEKPIARTENNGAPASVAPASNDAATPSLGLVDGHEFPVRPYRRGLTLEGISQPYLTAGGGSLGGFFRAGVSFSFSDMLGQHALRTAVQVGRRLDEFGTQATYVNRQSRWNWALTGEQVPMAIGASRTTPVEGGAGIDTSVVNERVVLRQVHRRLGGAAIYPFNSARRLELGTALHTVAVARESTTSIYAARTGTLLDENRSRTASSAPLVLFETGAALVHDSALVGPTSPVLGKRIRLEVAPTFGDLTFATVLADYRRYLMPVRPFTLAFRVKHLGRYGDDAGDTRLLPLAFDVRGVVRGYNARTLADEICGGGSAACATSQYLGMRQLAMANVEWRFPVIGAFRGTASYGALPIEGLVFSDTGWFRISTPDDGTAGSTARSGGHLRGSAGAGVRLNAAGFIVELTAARRLSGAARGWAFGVDFRPGF